jgi:hypothetical protein
MPASLPAEAIPREMIFYIACYSVQKVRARKSRGWKGVREMDRVSIIFNRRAYPFSPKDISR